VVEELALSASADGRRVLAVAYSGVTDPAQKYKWTHRVYGRRLWRPEP
jgi:hypothetical protein